MAYSLEKSEDIRSRKVMEFHDQGFHGDNPLIMLADIILENCGYFIETGTNFGSTLAHVARSHKDVQCFSCEPDPIAFEEATKNTRSYPNVQIYNEPSQEFLARFQKEMKDIFHENVLFWLDAHGYGFEWPLRDEVRFIAENFDHAHILIDDFKVPGLGCFGFDEYGKEVCSFEYIEDCFSDNSFDLYYPTYTDRTSKFHPLRGWGLIVLDQNFRIPECLKDKMTPSTKDSVEMITKQTPQAFSEAASQNDIERFNNNPENTYLISFPRTGSHWLRMMLELYFDRPTLARIFYKHRNDDYLLLHHHDVGCDVERSHVIYLYRDPVDTIFSQMNYYIEHENNLSRIEYWSEQYGRHLQKWLVDETFTCRKLILSYEELREETLAGFERISEYYSVPFDKIRAQEVIAQVSKSNVRTKTAPHDPQVLNVSPNYEHRRQAFRNRHAEFVWRNIVKGRDKLETLLRTELSDNERLFSGAPATTGKKLSSRIVGLVPGHNEEARIACCLHALAGYTDAIVFLDDCSDDNTVKIVQDLSEECCIEKIISKDAWYRDEPGDRNRLLQTGREIGGTHFIVLDADEMFTANCAKDHFLRQNILELKPGDYLSMVWIQLWRSVSQYRFDDSIWTHNYKNFAFCDDGKCYYESEFIHTSRLPSNLKGNTKILDGYNYGVLHFQFVNWRNLLIKQAWYRCLERIRQPVKPVEEINTRYAPSKDETALRLTEAPFKWFSGYGFFNEEAYHVPDRWREEQVVEWFEKYGRAYFSDLDIWDIDWHLEGSVEAVPHGHAGVQKYYQPKAGNTEAYIAVEPSETSGPTSSPYQALKDYEIDGVGRGLGAVKQILNHILVNKLQKQLSWHKDFWVRSVSVPVRCKLKHIQSGRYFDELKPESLEDLNPDFAACEGAERSQAISSYAEMIKKGVDLGAPVYISGEALNRIGGNVDPKSIFMIDGARRISASALAHKRTIDIRLILLEEEYKDLLNEGAFVRMKSLVDRIDWFNSYQTIPLLGLKGERTLKRFELMDMDILKDQTIMDFGCNLGQACIRALLSGAKEVWGIEGTPETFRAAKEIGQLSNFENLHFLEVDFNDKQFDQQIDTAFDGQVDYSFFFSVYRTKELIQREKLFQYIMNKTRKGIFFEGHAHPKIDTIEYYDWLFECFGIAYKFLGHSEGALRPLFYIPLSESDAPAEEEIVMTSKNEPYAERVKELPALPDEYLVSAIVSTYKSERFMAGRLQDLLDQTLGDRVEIIVVDSHSPENEKEIVESFMARHKNIKYLRTDERETVYQAWNRGIAMSTGRFITNANTDDRLRHDALERLAVALNDNPELGLAYGDFFITTFENMHFDGHKRCGHSRKPDYTPGIMSTGCHMGPQPMWRREVHDRIGYFDESFTSAGDYDFWCRLARHYPMRHIPEFMGLYYHNPQGIVNRDKHLGSEETRRVMNAYCDTFPAFVGRAPTGFYFRERVADTQYVNICMVTYNRIEFTKQSIDSVVAHTRYPHVITVVDNNSTDGTREYLKEQCKKGVIKNLVLLDENMGVAKASNLAWHLEKDAEYYLKLDNDIVIEKRDWLSNMVAFIESVPKCGAVAYNFEDKSYPMSNVNGKSCRIKKEGNLGGACILVPNRTRNLIGFWCEDYGLYGEEDADYGYRVKLKGMMNAYMEDERIGLHLPGGRAASIDPKTFSAKDEKEETQHAEYRKWKDESRRNNLRKGLYNKRIRDYGNGSLPLYVRSEFVPRYLSKQNKSLGPTSVVQKDGNVSSHGKVSIIIPVFNKVEFTRQCLDSIKRNIPTADCEILVVDNGSTDGTSKYFQSLNGKITAITNKENFGFAKACNQGATAALGEYLLFLNNDIVVNNGWLEPLVDVMNGDMKVAAVGSKLLFPDGNIQHAGVVIIEDHKLPDPLVGRHIYYGEKGDIAEANQMRTYQALTAACLLVRKSAFQKVGGFDEDYWNGYEDVDLCFKLQGFGWSLVYEPKSVAVHYESQSGPERFTQVSNNIKRLHEKWLNRIVPDIVIEEDGGIKPTDAGKISPYISPKQKDENLEIGFRESRALTSIIILTHNQLEYTKKCIDSIYRHTQAPFELIVVDNGSDDGTVAYLESEVCSNRNEVKIVRNAENLGFAAGNNMGMAQAEGDYILLMNNDVVVTPGWLGRMISCLDSFPEAGIVGPLTNYAPGPQFVNDVTYDTKTLSGLNRFSGEIAEKYSHKAERVLRVVGFCMLVKRAVLDKIGGMDDRYGLGNFEDDDFSLRATLSGFQSWMVGDCFVHHFGSRTFVGAGIDYNECLLRNWDLFKRKWRMPQELPYGSYNLSQIGRQTFDSEKDFIALPERGRSEVKDRGAEKPPAEDAIKRGAEKQFKKAESTVSASIIISTSNQQKYIKRCIESLENHTDEAHEVLFIDNGNAKAVLKWLRPIVKETENYQIIKCDKKAGMAKRYNAGIDASSGEYIIILHNDIVVSEGWLSAMLACINRSPDIGIVGPMTNNIEGIQRDFNADYPTVDEFDEYAGKFRKTNRHRKVLTGNLSGICIACRRDLMEKAGVLDEEFESEEIVFEDLCLRASLAGYENVIVSDVLLHHYNSHKVVDKDAPATIAKDRSRFSQKLRDIARDRVGKKLLIMSGIAQATELWEKDRIEDTVSIFKEMLRRFPEEKKISRALSGILIDSKQFAGAVEVLENMPEDEEDARKFLLLGYCKEAMARYDEAEACAERAFALDAAFAPTLNLKGMLAHRNGDGNGAEALFNRAIKSDPGYGEPYANLGFLKWLAKQEDEGLEFFEKGFILTPWVPDIFTNYHAAVKALGKFERAEPIFQAACKLHPKNKRLKYLLIDILVQQKKYAEAMVEIEAAMVEFDIDDKIISAALEVRNKLGAIEIVGASKKKGTVSLCMIVKDEEQNIEKCLRNNKPIVDEMIVVDTGSSDRTKDMAAVLGAKVYDFEWSDDFSAARNYSISLASGDWILVMDADEIVSSNDYDAFRKIVKKSPSRPAAYSFVTRNYNMRSDIIGLNSNEGIYGEEEAGVGWIPSDKVRLFKNGCRICFEFPVHEIVEPFLRRNGIEIKPCPIPIHHYGQLKEDKRASKGEEYYRIGKTKLDEMGNEDITAIYELAVQAGMLEKWDEAIALWERLIAVQPHVPLAYVNLGTAFQKTGKYDKAIQSVKKAMALDPDMKEAPNDYAIYTLYQGHAEQATPVLEDLVKRYPEYLSAQFKLAVAYCCEGRKEEGVEVLEKLGRTEMGLGLADSCYGIARKLISFQMSEYGKSVLEAAVESRNVNENVISLLNECRTEPNGGFVVSAGVYGMPEATLGSGA